jgi:hypothetical protein
MKRTIFILLGIAVALLVGFIIFSRPAVSPNGDVTPAVAP